MPRFNASPAVAGSTEVKAASAPSNSPVSFDVG
jgi:hypothetical protein